MVFILICRYGNQVVADELTFLYKDSRARGFGPEVRIRDINCHKDNLGF